MDSNPMTTLSLKNHFFSDIIKIWSRSDLITISIPWLFSVFGVRESFLTKRCLKELLLVFCRKLVFMPLKCIKLAPCRINLKPYLLLLHNFCITRKLLVTVCTALADVNILWCIVLANTYIRGINKAYHLPTNGVYSINKCHDHLSFSLYCKNFQNWLSCKMQACRSVRWELCNVTVKWNTLYWRKVNETVPAGWPWTRPFLSLGPCWPHQDDPICAMPGETTWFLRTPSCIWHPDLHQPHAPRLLRVSWDPKSIINSSTCHTCCTWLIPNAFNLFHCTLMLIL